MKNEEEEVSDEFEELEYFIDKGEKKLHEKEEEVEEEIESEEEKVEELEEEKEEIEQKKMAVEEKLRLEKEKVESLKKEEKSLKNAEGKAEAIRGELKEKGAAIVDSVKKAKEIFRKENFRDSQHKEKRNFLKVIYEDHYKKLLIIPFLLTLLALAQLAYQYNTTGDFFNRGVELKGGITFTLPEKSYNPDELEKILNSELGGDISVRSMSKSKGLLIEASDVGKEELLSSLEEIFGKLDSDNDYSIEEMGSSLGSSFFWEVIRAVIIAFVLMGLVVFAAFRVPTTTFTVVLAAFADIVITLAIFNLTGAKMGKGGVAALLMLIGYSVDTDILLNTKVFNRKAGTQMERIYSAIKTGMTMSLTTIVAVVVAMFFSQSDVIKQIMLILFIGLIVDTLTTWIQNVAIIRMYVEMKEGASK